MRCSSCEPLLDRYIEGTLAPREMARVHAHLRTCSRCEALLAEFRVIDALLATTNPIELAPNFTFAVMAEARSAPVQSRRHLSLWALLAIYVGVAWVVLSSAYVAFGVHGTRIDAARAAFGLAIAKIGSTFAILTHSFGPSAPLLLGGVVTLLAVDVLLAVFVLLLYRALRSRAQRPEAL